jgi:beta-glucosidase
VTVSVDVTNSGAVVGDEVVQLYLTHPGVPGAPLRALKGFERIHLERGEMKTVVFTLGARELSIVDESGKHRVVPGRVDVWVGGGQPVSRKGMTSVSGLKTDFTIASAAVLPD